jgi:hypothetical protein
VRLFLSGSAAGHWRTTFPIARIAADRLPFGSTHAGRAHLSGLSILWSTPLIRRFAHSMRETLSAVPIFSRISRIMRRKVVGSIRRSLHTCLSVLPLVRARSTIDSSLVKVGSNRNAEPRSMQITLCLCLMGPPSPSCCRLLLYGGVPQSFFARSG